MAKDYKSISLKNIAKIAVEGVICGIVDGMIMMKVPDGSDRFITWEEIVKVFNGDSVKVSIVSNKETEMSEV